MKEIFYILLFLIPLIGNTQAIAPKDYYLVDSLNLDVLKDSDRELIKSSLKIFHTAKDDTSKINALFDICENMMHDDWSKYQFFQYELIEKALQKTKNAAETRSLQKSLAGALNNIGYIYNHQGQITQALEYYHKSLNIREEIGDKQGIALSFNNIGSIYKNQGQIKKALEYWHKSLKIREGIGDKYGIANSLNNIGAIYNNQGQIKKALEYYHKSLNIEEEIGNKKSIAISLNNIGSIYKNQGQLKKALEYYHKSLEIREEIGDKEGIANILNNIGLVYNNQGQLNKALEYNHKSLKIREEIGDKEGIANSLNNIGAIYLKQNELQPAKEYLNKSLQLAKEVGSPKWIRAASGRLSTIAQKQGDYKTALEMHQLHVTMRDSINNKETYKASVQQRAKYEYEKQKAIDDKEHEKKLAIEKAEKEQHKLEAKHQQRQKYFLYGGLALALLFGGFIFNRFRVTSKQKGIIEDQKQKVDEAYNELEEKNTEILDSINYAKRIQNAILPPPKLVKEYLPESFILYKPKDVVAGDFYWMETSIDSVTNQKVLLFAACDCTGHGVPGAMVSVVCNNGLNRSAREYGLTDPGQILDKTREIVIQEFEKSEDDVKDGMDIALCALYSSSDSHSHSVLQFAGANNPLWIIRNGEIIETPSNKQPIGKFDKPVPYTTHTIELLKGDAIYVFSDGFVDQFGGEKGKKFKPKAFRELLLSIQEKDMEQQKTIIDQTFETWRGKLEQLDDVCVIGVKI